MARWLREDLRVGNYHSTQGIETTRANVGDVRLQRKTDGRLEVYGLLVQAKKGKRPSPWKAVAEAEEAGERVGGDVLPVAFVHRDQREPGAGADKLVVMRPEVFAALLDSYERTSW